MSGPRRSSDRVAGLAILAFAAVAGLIASTFRVAFLTDPIGPRAVPWLAAAMLALGGAFMLARPSPDPVWPARTTARRIAAAVTGFVVYALILDGLGFIASTTLLVTALAILFGGRPLRGLLAALALSALMWLLFVQALGVPLPIGALFTRAG